MQIWVTASGKRGAASADFPGLQLKRTGEQLRLAGTFGNPLINPLLTARHLEQVVRAHPVTKTHQKSVK